MQRSRQATEAGSAKRRCKASQVRRKGARSGRCRARPAARPRSPAHTPARCHSQPTRTPRGWWPRAWSWAPWWKPTEPASPWEKESRVANRNLSGKSQARLASCEGDPSSGRLGRDCTTAVKRGRWQRVSIDRFPQCTIKWLSLPVLADPFWGRLLWLFKRRSGKHSKQESQQAHGLRSCALWACA